MMPVERARVSAFVAKLFIMFLSLTGSWSFSMEGDARRASSYRFMTNEPIDYLQEVRQNVDLPIVNVLEQICNDLTVRPNLLLEAPPGAGKTTLLPLALMSSSTQHIIVVEPRRVATRSAAQRMSTLLLSLSSKSSNAASKQTPSMADRSTLVGYAMRGESRYGSKITVMTDGVLLNKLREDPFLSGVDVVVLDEFHERNVGSDTAFALVREAQRQGRSDLKMVIMSATLLGDDENTGAKLVHALGGHDLCSIVRSDGRQFPIQVQWSNHFLPTLQPLGALMTNRDSLVNTMCDAIEHAIMKAPAKGDVLAFLPGVAEIRRVVQELRTSRKLTIDVFPLYGELSRDEQDRAINPSSKRRVIVSSPIAEASLTLEGVTCVVDSGLRREPRCDVDTGMPRLVTTRCSKASAIQRAGRAGRLREGLCLRIYSESEFDTRFQVQSPPEILSTDLSPTTLLLLDWGCSTKSEILKDLPFVDAPEEEALDKSLQLLVDLEAVVRQQNDHFMITPQGQQIARMPTHPRIATTIVRAKTHATLAAAVAAAFLLDDETSRRGGDGADLAPRVRQLFSGTAAEHRVLIQFASRISDKARDAVLDVLHNNVPILDVARSVGEALLPGFLDLVAQRKSDASYGGTTFMLSLGRSARLDGTRDTSEFIVVVATSTGDDGTARIRGFASITKETLLSVAVEKDMVFTVPSRGHEVRARRVLSVGSLELLSTPLPAPSADEVTIVLRNTIRSLGGVYPALLQSLSQEKQSRIHELRSRVRLAMKLSENPSAWPACFQALDAQENGSVENDVAQILEKLIEPWLAAAGSLKNINLFEVLLSSMTPTQQHQLDEEFPSQMDAPDGSQITVSYTSGTPMACGKLQQFFGTVNTPFVGPNSNRVPVALSLLSPSGKPLGQTMDLAFFWRETYPSVRREMRGRYAKHPWPEDPVDAIATRQTKKQQARATESEESRPEKKKRGKRR